MKADTSFWWQKLGFFNSSKWPAWRRSREANTLSTVYVQRSGLCLWSFWWGLTTLFPVPLKLRPQGSLRMISYLSRTLHDTLLHCVSMRGRQHVVGVALQTFALRCIGSGSGNAWLDTWPGQIQTDQIGRMHMSRPTLVYPLLAQNCHNFFIRYWKCSENI